MKRTIILTLTALALAACSNATDTSGTASALGGGDADAGTPGAAVYLAQLEPLNADVNGRPVRGTAMLRVNRGELTARVNAQGLAADMPHPQHVHGQTTSMVARCPDASDDANGDGIVDVVEGLPDYGPILVTLDSDLTDGPGTQLPGLPLPTNRGGAIAYRQSAPLSAVQAGIDAAYGSTVDLAPARRAVVLHGVSFDTELPDTVQSIGGLDPHLTLPVACGEL